MQRRIVSLIIGILFLVSLPQNNKVSADYAVSWNVYDGWGYVILWDTIPNPDNPDLTYIAYEVYTQLDLRWELIGWVRPTVKVDTLDTGEGWVYVGSGGFYLTSGWFKFYDETGYIINAYTDQPVYANAFSWDYPNIGVDTTFRFSWTYEYRGYSP